MEFSFPEDAVIVNGKYDREFNSADWARVTQKMYDTGVHPVPEDALHVVAVSGRMEVSVSPGFAFVRGHCYTNDAPLHFEINTANANYNRKDIIVIRQSNTDRRTFALYRWGEPSGSPQPPELIRNDDEYEIQIAEILVKAGAQEITQADITDTRASSALCGLAVVPLYHVDLESFYQQYNTRKEQEFSAMDAHEATYADWWQNFTQIGESTWINYKGLWMSRMTNFDDWFGTIQGNIHDEIYFDIDNWAYRAGETYTTARGSDGSITKTLTSRADGHVIARSVMTRQADGSIKETLTNDDLGIDIVKTTRRLADGTIEEKVEAVTIR